MERNCFTASIRENDKIFKWCLLEGTKYTSEITEMDIVKLRTLNHELTLESWFHIFGEGAQFMEPIIFKLSTKCILYSRNKVHPVDLSKYISKIQKFFICFHLIIKIRSPKQLYQFTQVLSASFGRLTTVWSRSISVSKD